MLRRGLSLKSKCSPFLGGVSHLLTITSEREELELKLAEVPEIEKRIAELTASADSLE